MSSMWLVIVCSFIVPLLMIISGVIFLRRTPQKINCIFGYRTSMSMLNKDTWKFAHMCCGKIWCKCGLICFGLTLIIMVCCLVINKNIIETLSVVVILLQCIMIFVTIFVVERKLKSNFDKEGNRK